MHARSLRPGARIPWETVLLPLWVVGGLLVTIAALVVHLGQGEGPAEGAVGPEVLVPCARPELVVILDDNSFSVVDLDPEDTRLEAVVEVVDSLAAQPCSPEDLVAVVSFTGATVLTGPGPARDLGPIRRAEGGGTDLAAAVDVAVDLASDHPRHRPVIVVVSDLEDGSGVPLDRTLDRLTDLEVIVVSIGATDPGPGVTELELRSTVSIAGAVIEVINGSRQRS